ncbi:MAG: hypothetical protein ISEC1_P1059 [Thiomicrorhabdus sp.]|nr:MAG: hypothetical protein ISEC1_P1059 [Thiomicrorhabdus sp.]
MLINTYQGRGNLVLITHKSNIRALSFEMLKHLDFLVIQPSDKADGEFEALGLIRFKE